MRLGPHSIVRKRGTDAADDPYGQVDWSDPDELTVDGCSVQPGTSQKEILLDRDAVTTLWTVWAPGAPDITERDRIAWQGVDYEVDGTIQSWGFPPLDHLVIPLKAVSG